MNDDSMWIPRIEDTIGPYREAVAELVAVVQELLKHRDPKQWMGPEEREAIERARVAVGRWGHVEVAQ